MPGSVVPKSLEFCGWLKYAVYDDLPFIFWIV